LHAVSVEKPSERMSNFWTVRLFKNRIRTEFRFSAHSYYLYCYSLAQLTFVRCQQPALNAFARWRVLSAVPHR